MFENVLAQAAVERLAADIARGELPPSLLFSGPPCSGKGTTALELARVLSCEAGGGLWNCSCPSCERHRALVHPDLLLFGPRSFAPEISAAAAAFLREPRSSARFLFLRSVRKLASRFAPALWEGDEAKLGNAAALLANLEDLLEELEAQHAGAGHSGPGPEDEAATPGLRKTVAAAVSAAAKLESSAVADTTPIAQIRRASYWARLAPSGLRKTIVIENADRMHEGARNALLKVLEEPPETATFVLSSSRRSAMMQTILSRVRTYVFVERGVDEQREVVRRVFRDSEAAAGMEVPAASVSAGDPNGGVERGSVAAYLESFLPVPPEALEAAAAYFAASAAAAGLERARRSERDRGAALDAVVEAARLAAERGGMPPPTGDARAAVAAATERCGAFEPRTLFVRFLDGVARAARPALVAASASDGPGALRLAEAWRSAAAVAAAAVGTYNQNPALALRRLFSELADAVADTESAS